MKKLYGLLAVAVLLLSATCRNEEGPGKPRIDGLKFAESSKSLSIGDITTISMSVTPAEAKNQERVEYSVSQKGVIEIKEGSSNDGVIIEGKSRGTVVVTGRVGSFTDYCSITVSGSDERIIPHIISPVSVMEVPMRERRSITVSLAGGSPADNSGFTWSYTNQNIISFESTGSVGVFDTLETGSAVVTVRHPKAQYPVDVLVYVLGSGESPVYITGDSNVIDLKKDAGNHEFQVKLIGGLAEDNGRFVYQVIEGNNYIGLNGNGQFGTIMPKAAGLALVRITHPKAHYPFDIQVIISEELEYRYIDVNKTLVLISENEHAVVEAQFVGDAPDDAADRYNFSLSEEGVVGVSQSKGLFFINAVKKGKVILSVSNTYADFNREILVVVNNPVEGIIDNQKYISTNQNVITMEAGGSDSILKMMLVGGNEGDKNSFIWTVDDSSIISVSTGHGDVRYRSMYRAMYGSAPFEQFEAQALVSAKKTGTAKITLQHPKAKNEATVLVKVYPKGTFAAVPVVLGGEPYYKVERGTYIEMGLFAASGSASNIGDVKWTTDKPAVAGVEATGLTGIIRGLSNGVTTLTVSGGNLKHPFSAVIIVNLKDELDKQKFIYVLNPFVTLTTGQNVITGVLGENMSADDMKAVSYINNDNAVIALHSSGSQMMLTALKPGTAEITVKGGETNEIKIFITVEEPKVNPEQPFYLAASDDIAGIVRNQSADIEVTLVGGSAAKYESSIVWSIENSRIAQLVGNGNKARITGIAEGQTVINVSHAKSVNNLKMVIFVVASSGDLNNKVALYIEKNNYLIEREERIGISLKTNASDAQKAGIQWSINNADIVEFDVSSDRMTVFITGKTPGIAQITVNHSQNIIPQIIYVSVVSNKTALKYISVPSIIETVAGNTLEIKAVTQNLKSFETQDIVWKVDNGNYVSIAGNGASCIVQAHSNGNAVITVELTSLNFKKDIIVYVYSSYEEMASSYVISCEQSFYRINKGDVIDVSLVFGAKGFPEHEINNIRWSVSANNTVSAAGNGKKASIRALNTGIAYVYAESDAAKNKKITIEIEVIENVAVNSGYRFEIANKDRIKGIVTGGFADILVRIYNGATEVVSGLNKIQFEAENTDVIGLTVIDNNVRVTAKKTGQSYITVSHPQVAGSERILIYTASSQYELDNAYPLYFAKSNYLLKKGDAVRIQAQTIDNDEAQLSKIRFEIEGRGIISISEISRKEINVSALEKGNDVIAVYYDNAVVQRIYVSVTLTVDSDLSTYLVTENIIGMVAGRTYTTRVNTNLAEDMLGTLFWVSEDFDIVTVETYNGVSADLKAHSAGMAYVTVRTGNIERKILVFVCANEQELRNYHAVNMDQRYFVMNKGQSMTLHLFSYQGTAQGITQYSDYYNSGGNFGGVIELTNKTAQSVTVNGGQEGIAGIRITNSYYNFDIAVYIEVRDGKGESGGNITLGNYITARQTLYVIEPDERDVAVNVDVMGENFFQEGYFVWEGYDSTIINVRAQGSAALVNPVKNGQTAITVRNLYCDNLLTITVIVGNRFTVENTDETYFYAEKTVYDLNVNDSPLVVYYELRNNANNYYHDFGYKIGGSSVTVNYGNPGRLTVTPRQTGMTTVTIYASDDISITVYFIVRENNLLPTVYLTTQNNFVIAGINEIKAVDIQLIGYNEVDSNQFKWSINKKSVAQVVGNGNRGQIYPAAEGDAVITVTHYKAKYDLTINLRVTKNMVDSQLVYLTTQTNVIEALVGEENYIYVQKKGGNDNLRDCTWTVDDPGVLSISGNEYTGIFKIKKAGVARINVTSVETVYPLRIVVVAKENSGSPLYITASDTLLEMVPGLVNRRVSVSLAGGSESDNNRFNWSVYHQNPADVKIAMSNGNVVALAANANQCNITAVNEGVARIRVSHEKADNPLYITVQVSRYKQIEFPYNQKQMMTGDSEFIRINVPNYENFKDKVFFVSDNPEVCTMIGNSSNALLTAHGKGFAIVKARIEGKDQEAELYVNVVDEESPDTNRIVTGKTSFSFHPRSSPITISAQLFGVNMINSENDNIWWELVNLDGSNDPVLDIYPVQAMNKERGSREVQISPRREGEAQIVIGHRYVNPKYYKTISILVSEVSNALTLDKNLVKLGRGQTQTLKATILGAKSKDYDDIQWLVDTEVNFDGTRKEIVRIMGEGQNVMLYPMSDGTVEVTARYKGLFATCTVTVESAALFSVQARSVRLYPGGVADIGFDIRPLDSYIVWYPSDYGYSDPIIRMDELWGQKILRITGLREGSVQIQGIANGNRATINVIVAYDYKVLADAFVQFTPILKSTDKPTLIKYTVYPPNTRIQASVLPAKVNIEIMNPVFVSDQEPAEGIIYITATEEIENTVIKWELYKPDGTKLNPPKFAETVIAVQYDPKERIMPYFVRYDGVWSNRSKQGSGSTQRAVSRPVYTGFNNEVLGEILTDTATGSTTVADRYTLALGDGENHYILFDRMYPNSYFDVKIGEGYNNSNEFIDAKIVNIEHNGTVNKALLISSKKSDVIQYDRVAYNKKLYVTMKTNYAKSSANFSYSSSPKRIWIDEKTVQKQIGTQNVTYDLWELGEGGADKRPFVYQIMDVYLYTSQQYDEIILNCGYNPGLSLVSSLQDVNMNMVPPGYMYYSTSSSFEYNASSVVILIPGINIQLMREKQGYFYTIGTINANSGLFNNVVFENAMNVSGNYRVSLTAVRKSETIPKYDNVIVYVYISNNMDGASNNSGTNSKYLNSGGQAVSFVGVEDSVEDSYGNKAKIMTQLEALFPAQYNNEGERMTLDFSFNKYYIRDATVTPSTSPQESSWDFLGSYYAQWNNTFKIYDDYWVNDFKWPREKKYFFMRFEGLILAPPHDYNHYPINWGPSDLADIIGFYKGSNGRHTGGINGEMDNKGNLRIINDKETLSIFGNHDEYGPAFCTQEAWERHGGDAGKNNDLYNSIVKVYFKYRWVPIAGNKIIVPISYMTRFPFYFTNKISDYLHEMSTFTELDDINNRFVIRFDTPGDEVTSTPMPTLNTSVARTSSVTVPVTYSLFGDTSDRTIFFSIEYEERNCHRRYTGNTTMEVEMETDWKNLEPIDDDHPFIFKQKVKK